MTLNDLKLYYGCKTQLQLKEKIKVSRVTLWKWQKHGIPYKTQTAFEVETKGKLKATQTQQ